jgi:FAD synthase
MQAVHLAVGNFDGIHLGHRALLQRAVENAHIRREIAAVLTFHPHPKQVLRLPNVPQLIYPIHHRCYLLRSLDWEAVRVQPFDEAFATLTPEAFFEHLLQQFPTLTAVYVGEDYRFGKHCVGNTHTLEELCRRHGIELYVCPNLNDNGEKISSTRIRKALREGSIDVANRLLGAPYHCIGLVRKHPYDVCTPLTETIENAGDNSETLFFRTHNELNPKNGSYFCTLRNKYGQQTVHVRLEDEQIRFLSPIQPILRRGGVLSFEKKL